MLKARGFFQAIIYFKWQDGHVIAYARVFKENNIAVFDRVGVKGFSRKLVRK